jgi:Fic family protein
MQLNTPHTARYIWQQPAWPAWRFDADALSAPLAQARLRQGRVIGKAEAIGMTGEAMAQVVNDIWIGEVIATAAIEGQKLDAEQVRSPVMRMLGIGGNASAARHVDSQMLTDRALEKAGYWAAHAA